jgi:ribosomal-protein-alanine N-acetyltransferase
LPAGPADAAVLAKIHAFCFPRGWTADEMAPFLASPECLCLVAAPAEGASPQGLLMARRAADEAELLTLGVVPCHRRQGLARALLRAATEALVRAGAKRLLLEVAAGNDSALPLYRALGAKEIGHRPRYYAGGTDAAIFNLALGGADGQ